MTSAKNVDTCKARLVWTIKSVRSEVNVDQVERICPSKTACCNGQQVSSVTDKEARTICFHPRL